MTGVRMSSSPHPQARLLNAAAFVLLSLVVLTIPFDVTVESEQYGSVTRVIGYAALAAAAVAVAVAGRLQTPRATAVWVLLFGAWTVLSMAWTVSLDDTLDGLPTVVRVLGLFWLLYELVNSRPRAEKIMLAYVVGSWVCVLGMLWFFRMGRADYGYRYTYASTMGQVHPDGLAVMTALGVPIAWYLQAVTGSRAVRWIGRLYIPPAVLAVILTGSRGGLFTVLVASLAVLRGVPMLRGRALVLLTLCLGAAFAGAYWLAPEPVVARLQTSWTELTSGTLNYRTLLWGNGFRLLEGHWLVGVGVGAFRAEAFALGGLPIPMVAHSVPLGILFELGAVGFTLFAGLFVSLMARSGALPRAERWFSRGLLLTWLVGGATLSVEFYKFTWLVFGLLSAMTVRAPLYEAARGGPSGLRQEQLPQDEPGTGGAWCESWT